LVKDLVGAGIRFRHPVWEYPGGGTFDALSQKTRLLDFTDHSVPALKVGDRQEQAGTVEGDRHMPISSPWDDDALPDQVASNRLIGGSA